MSTQSTETQLEEAGIIAAILSAGGRSRPAELELTSDLDPTQFADALGRLRARGAVHVAEYIEVPDAAQLQEKTDRLGAVILHILRSAGDGGVAVEQVTSECDRKPDSESDRAEVTLALCLLVNYDLAIRVEDRWFPTRPAIQADRLSF